MSVPVSDAAPDFAEPFVAWRVWRVVERDGGLALASVVKRTVWPAGEPLVAECLRCRPLRSWLLRRPRHAAPESGCACGIYASDAHRVDGYLRDALPDAIARVVGRVSLWGTVIECERGFRTSHAYPLELYVPADACRDRRVSPADVAAGLARYGVPVELLESSRRAPGLLDLEATG